jgi:hypothetical protein
MLPELISHSPDLKQLWDEGHEMEIKGEYLLIGHIPYVNFEKKILYGILVTYVHQSGGKTIEPDTHVIHFIGEYPCNTNATPIAGIKHGSGDNELIPGLTVNHSFSNRPPNGKFSDYYEKITSYIRVISHSAKSIDETVTEKTFEIIESKEEDSPFHYPDTNSSKAEINPITAKLRGQKIAIVGLGGTGSYILDLVAKTPVQEIHLFDGDNFFQHNAFRTPGAAPKVKFQEHFKKTEYLAQIYSHMHRRVHSHPIYIDTANVVQLTGKDFVFISMDTGQAKKIIVEYLEENEINFIDAGMGLEEVDDQLIGQLRVTASTVDKRDHLRKRVSFAEDEENLYDRNIQIADLNALNGTLAVIKWKKLFNFYQDLENEHHTTYVVNSNELFNDDSEI